MRDVHTKSDLCIIVLYIEIYKNDVKRVGFILWLRRNE